MPKNRSGNIFGFKIVLASQRTPNIKPKKNVAEYRKTSSSNLAYLVIPDSRIALPRKKLKNRGEADGNKRQSTMHAILLCFLYLLESRVSQEKDNPHMSDLSKDMLQL